MTRLKAILQDIKDLEGKAVEIFGQPVTLDSEEDKGMTPRVKDFITALMDYEANEVTSRKIIEKHHEDNDFIAKRSDNSYNWSGHVDHNFSYHHYQYNDNDFIIFAVHRYGDVRGNYTDEAVLKMTLDEFYEVMSESLSVFESVEVDGVSYNLNISAYNESIEVYADGGESFEVYCYADKEDITQAIKDHLAEAVAESKGR